LPGVAQLSNTELLYVEDGVVELGKVLCEETGGAIEVTVTWQTCIAQLGNTR
jgi:hypothetical protein